MIDLNLWRATIGGFSQPLPKSRFKCPAICITGHGRLFMFAILAWGVALGAQLGATETLWTTEMMSMDILVKPVVPLDVGCQKVTSIAFSPQDLTRQWHSHIVIQTLLIRGGVEQNPGPLPEPGRVTRQTKLSFAANDIEDKIKSLEERVDSLECENRSLKQKIDNLENQSRRSNLIIHGLGEDDKESWEECETKAKRFINSELRIEGDIMIERAHRLGKKRTPNPAVDRGPSSSQESSVMFDDVGEVVHDEKPRPLIIKFSSWKTKEKVLAAARGYYKDNKGIVEGGVSEDFSAGVREVRRKLVPFLKRMKENNPFLQAYIRYDKLVAGKKVYVLNASGDDVIPASRTQS